MLYRKTGQEAGLLADKNPTGRFDVRIKQTDGMFKLVHSKHAGDGFVDSQEKTVAIIQAVLSAVA